LFTPLCYERAYLKSTNIHMQSVMEVGEVELVTDTEEFG